MKCVGCRGYREQTRRAWLRSILGATGGASFFGLGNLEALANVGTRRTADSVILLWMGGGMSHIDTFDPQPGTDVGGPFEAIATTAEGIRISQHLPGIAERFKHLSLIRSMTSNEAAHDRATHLMHTGYPPIPTIQHSTIGSIIAKYKGVPTHDQNLPPYVSIGLDWAAGYLGPRYAPYYIGNARYGKANLEIRKGLGRMRFNSRLRLLDQLDTSFAKSHPESDLLTAYAEHFNAALLMMRPQTAKVFDLDDEPLAVRSAYGATSGFGQGALLARRLVQRGVRFVELTHGGWDTHQNNFPTVEEKSAEVDRVVSTLIDDLKAKELFDRTVIVLTSEFGRTPRINGNQGRDHYARVWSTLIGGGGIQPGRQIGASDAGKAVARDPVRVGDLHATLCKVLGIDHTQINHSSDGRPFRITKEASAKPIASLIA